MSPQQPESQARLGGALEVTLNDNVSLSSRFWQQVSPEGGKSALF